MKATIEFEVTKCQYCLLWDRHDNSCIHPESEEHSDESIVDFIEEDTYPAWCPILGEKK
jgi:hypothetical protein